MIRDARVLRAGFVPREIEHRDAEVNHLSSVLEPITNGEPADTAIVTGPSGTGKTCISKFVTERLREEVLDVESTYVNCWRNYTRFRTLYQILDELGATIDIHRQSTPHDELIDRLQQHDGPRTVVILDEVDQLEDPSVIYDLHSLPQFAIICIANKEEELFSRVDDRLVSRLRSSEHVRMDKYHDEPWSGGFNLPFLRTRLSHHELEWPFMELPYVDTRDIFETQFNTSNDTLEGVYEELIGDGLGALDPFEDSGKAVDAWEDGDFESVALHNIADIRRTRALTRLAERYCSKSDFSMKSLDPVA